MKTVADVLDALADVPGDTPVLVGVSFKGGMNGLLSRLLWAFDPHTVPVASVLVFFGFIGGGGRVNVVVCSTQHVGSTGGVVGEI